MAPKVNVKSLIAPAVVLAIVAASACTVQPSSTSTPVSSPAASATTQAPTSTPVSGQVSLPAQQATPTPLPTQVTLPEQTGLTPDDIVAAQEQVLVNIYNRTVPSVVQITTDTGEGSGFVWDVKGHIVTNYHVVQNARSINITFNNGRTYRGSTIGFDRDADLAVVKIDPAGTQLTPADLGVSSEVVPGQLAVAIGDPFGNAFTMTTGIVSQIGRGIQSGFTNFNIPATIQTDAAINPGNSGGPLMDRRGRVIGINVQIASEVRQYSGVGYAIPIDLAKRVIPSLISTGRYDYAFIGISGNDVKDFRSQTSLPNDLNGAMVFTAVAGGPAAEAGIKGDSGSTTRPNFDGDVITAADGRAIQSMDELISYLALHKSPGDRVTLTVYRSGQTREVTVTLDTRTSAA